VWLSDSVLLSTLSGEAIGIPSSVVFGDTQPGGSSGFFAAIRDIVRFRPCLAARGRPACEGAHLSSAKGAEEPIKTDLF
jgi:hypothetical protein